MDGIIYLTLEQAEVIHRRKSKFHLYVDSEVQ